jgi:hypothetical protein
MCPGALKEVTSAMTSPFVAVDSTLDEIQPRSGAEQANVALVESIKHP